MAVPLDTLTPPTLQAAGSNFRPAMPPEAPLAMPVQSLEAWNRRDGHRPLAPERRPWGARAFVFGAAALLTAYGAWQMYEVVSVSGGTTSLQYVLLVLFTLNFSWIALAFSGAILGDAR